MSIRIMQQVWDASEQKGSGLLLLLAIADYADECGFAWPGVETLARKTRISRRHVFRLLTELRERGELILLERPGRSHLYIITVGATRPMLEQAIERAEQFGASIPDRGDILSRVYLSRGDKMSPPGDILSLRGDMVSPDPSLSVIDPSFEEIWVRILERLTTMMDRQTFDRLLRGSRIDATDNGTWQVAVANSDILEVIERRERKRIDQAAEGLLPDGITLQFVGRADG